MSVSTTATRVHTLRQARLSVLGRHRSVPHLERKLYHALMGLICFSLYAFVLTRTQALWALGLVGGLFVAIDLIRLRVPAVNAVALRWFGKLMRREELKGVTGNSFYVLGLVFIVLLFPKPVVLLSVLYLALGDPTAAMVGSLYGRHKLIGKKSWEGAAANGAISFLATLVVGTALFGLGLPNALALAFVGSLVSVGAELCPLPVDDNFSIPVLSALGLSLVLSVSGIVL